MTVGALRTLDGQPVDSAPLMDTETAAAVLWPVPRLRGVHNAPPPPPLLHAPTLPQLHPQVTCLAGVVVGRAPVRRVAAALAVDWWSARIAAQVAAG